MSYHQLGFALVLGEDCLNTQEVNAVGQRFKNADNDHMLRVSYVFIRDTSANLSL